MTFVRIAVFSSSSVAGGGWAGGVPRHRGEQAAHGRAAGDLALESVDPAVARADELVKIGMPVVSTPQVRADRGEDRNVIFTLVLDGPDIASFYLLDICVFLSFIEEYFLWTSFGEIGDRPGIHELAELDSQRLAYQSVEKRHREYEPGKS